MKLLDNPNEMLLVLKSLGVEPVKGNIFILDAETGDCIDALDCTDEELFYICCTFSGREIKGVVNKVQYDSEDDIWFKTLEVSVYR